MELAIPGGEPSSADLFFDAFDAFASADPQHALDSSASSSQETLREVSRATAFRRRRSAARSTPIRRSLDANYPSLESSEKRSEIPSNQKDAPVSNIEDASTMTVKTDQISGGRDLEEENSSGRDEARAASRGFPPQGVLFSLADLVVKAVLFQISMLIRFFTLPMWLAYNSLLFVVNPFGTIRLACDGLKERLLWLCKFVLGTVSPFVSEMLREQHGIATLVLRMAWGCFWSFYVGILLSGLLIMGFFGASIFMSQIVEEPLQLIRHLNFDYTKVNPSALVLLIPCNGAGRSLECDDKAGFGNHLVQRVIPPKHKLHLTISLTLPESDYNRNLGVFQVRVEFLSAHGKVTFGRSHHCMLRFKSNHIRFMETFLKSGPLLAGYSSESQVLELKMSGFTEGAEPTMGIRVVLEQRAEFRPGAGIPEIYAASLKLESDLPLLKKIIWSWKRTLLIWTATGIFIWELLIALICCRPVLIPRLQPRTSDGSPSTLQHISSS
ncbi:hypothetical protein AXF42_Ash011096 [Apostasia shenzhenica]|uniref:Seipin-2 n=1 Tax=Apostasia shenzhenica TaxID=1088818 RepID=A0A2I0AKT7_9ASPA|nr:hypothetical protein AXF42_Ash011096 [Apostasia shenzhenica]